MHSGVAAVGCPAELVAREYAVGRKRIARLLRRAGLRGIGRCKGTRTTIRAAHTRAAPDLMERDFTVRVPSPPTRDNALSVAAADRRLVCLFPSS